MHDPGLVRSAGSSQQLQAYSIKIGPEIWDERGPECCSRLGNDLCDDPRLLSRSGPMFVPLVSTRQWIEPGRNVSRRKNAPRIRTPLMVTDNAIGERESR